jgi:hypothetical protein
MYPYVNLVTLPSIFLNRTSQRIQPTGKVLANCQAFGIKRQSCITFGNRFGQFLEYFRTRFAVDVLTLAVNLVLTDPPTITTRH